MGIEKGFNQRLFIGDGGKVNRTGTTFSVDEDAGTIKILDSASGFIPGGGTDSDDVKVGMRVDISGLVDNDGELEGYVSAVAAGEITITDIYTGFGEEAVVVDEAAGETVTLKFTEFHRISEEQTLSFDVNPETEETGSKERSGQSRQSVVSHSFSFQCAGKADFPDTNGLGRVKKAVVADEEVICRVIENTLGHIWEGPFALSMGQSSSYTETTNFSVSGQSSGLAKYMEVGV